MRVLIDNREIEDGEKLMRNMMKLMKNRREIAKRLLLRGYFCQLFIAFTRYLFHKPQNKEWAEIINNYPSSIMKDLKIENSSTVELDDGNMKLKISKDRLEFGDYSLLFGTYREVVISNQYNVSSGNIKDKIVIDGGACLGEFAIYCVKLGAKRVYAFEPVSETYNQLLENIKINNMQDKIIPIKKALGDRDEKANINIRKDSYGASSIKEKIEGSKSEIIDLIKLDNFTKDKIGFIKLDVEGYEEKALIGMRGIIKKYKPILCFSAYHKPSDKVILPKLIKSIEPNYDISLLKRDEEDFYCVFKSP